MTDKFEERCIVSGIGQSAVGRRLPESELALTAQACIEAIDDAGLSRDDIDGLVAFPGRINIPPPGFTGPGTDVVQDMLGLDLSFRLSSFDGPGQLQAVVNACMAVASGLARHVLVYRTVTEASGRVGGSPPRAPAPGALAERTDRGTRFVPFGAYSPANWLALTAQRHFHVFGTTREQLGAIAIVERANATLNPKAVLREPLTM
jgi:acetyl-CoA acetyltransferase